MYPTERSKEKKHYAVYECPFCGKHFKAYTVSVNREHTKSCGCRKNQLRVLSNKSFYHGLSHTRLFDIWSNMKRRCGNEKDYFYYVYGGRGITVCDEWRNDFMAFYTWAMDNGYKEGLQIDRRDNDKGYCPKNCRWATAGMNSRNKGKQRNNTSGYKGLNKKGDKWAAQIGFDGKNIYLGIYDTKEEAAKAYDDAAKMYHGEYACLNFKETISDEINN